MVLILETRVQLQNCKRAPWEPWLSENGAKGARGVKASVLVGFRFRGAVVFKIFFNLATSFEQEHFTLRSEKKFTPFLWQDRAKLYQDEVDEEDPAELKGKPLVV